MRRYQKMDEEIPMIVPQEVPMFSPYTAGRNNMHNMRKAIEVENVGEAFDQTPIPDKIESYSGDPQPYVESDDSAPSDRGGSYLKNDTSVTILNIIFKLLKYIFIFMTAIFASKVIMKYLQQENYNQQLMITVLFFLLSFIFEWSANK